MLTEPDTPHGKQQPLGNFEIAPEFNDDKQPADVVYQHFHCHYLTDFESFISIRSTALRGTEKPMGYVDLGVVAGDTFVELPYTPTQARALARLLLVAADDADAALAKLAEGKEGGAA